MSSAAIKNLFNFRRSLPDPYSGEAKKVPHRAKASAA